MRDLRMKILRAQTIGTRKLRNETSHSSVGMRKILLILRRRRYKKK
jgi:hypothetical protein